MEGTSGRPKVKKVRQTCIISALFFERICDYQVNNGLANRIEWVLKDHRKCTSAWICGLFQINRTLEISTCEWKHQPFHTYLRLIFWRHLMTSIENSVSEPPNLKIFPRFPTRLAPSTLVIMPPIRKNLAVTLVFFPYCALLPAFLPIFSCFLLHSCGYFHPDSYLLFMCCSSFYLLRAVFNFLLKCLNHRWNDRQLQSLIQVRYP